MSEFIIALQYHAGDRDQAIALAELMAANEPKFCEDVILLIVQRFDAELFPLDVVERLAKKFSVWSFTTTTKAEGWPDGCNAMARDTLREIRRRWATREWGEAEGALLLEPDCIPIQKDWIHQIRAEWELARMVERSCWLMGTWRDGGGVLGHINGNMVVRMDFEALVDLGNLPYGLAWDCAISPQVHDHWIITGLICNRWLERNLSDEDIRTHRTPSIQQKPVLVHGCKDDSVMNYARKILLA